MLIRKPLQRVGYKKPTRSLQTMKREGTRRGHYTEPVMDAVLQEEEEVLESLGIGRGRICWENTEERLSFKFLWPT